MTDKKRNLAPVVIFAYNRPEVFQMTLEALSQNELSGQSDLIIFCDGPQPGASQNELENINEVRKIAKEQTWANALTVYESETNNGLAKAIVDGVSQIIDEYEKIIVLEDDLVTSTYFLKYMNDALERYWDSEEVISIHAYNYPVRFPENLPETFFLTGADCLGWATWKRGWALFNNDAGDLYKIINEQDRLNAFDFDGCYDYSRLLLENAIYNNSWAIKWYASAFAAEKLTLYPAIPLVKHIGLTGTNINQGSQDHFGHEVSNKPITSFEPELKESQAARLKIKHFFKPEMVTALKQDEEPGFRRIIRQITPPVVMQFAKKITGR